MNDPEMIAGYNPFMVNRALSYHQDTIFLANEMNCMPNLSKKAQYDYLFHAVRPRKRRAKWHKVETHDDIELIIRAYKYSRQKARAALGILTDDQLKRLRKQFDTGGKKSD